MIIDLVRIFKKDRDGAILIPYIFICLLFVYCHQTVKGRSTYFLPVSQLSGVYCIYLFSFLIDPLDTTQNKCKICYKIFPSLHKLNIHSRTHLEVLAFQCNQCESSFPNKTRLRLHKEGIHTKGEFVCIICHLICNNKLALNRHNRIHKGWYISVAITDFSTF